MKCPVCRKDVERVSPEYPFCCERCRVVDLGNWAAERYVIPGSAQAPGRENSEGEDEE